MSEVKVNKISPRTNCGTVTLGDSGDSFVIPSGATITNNGTQSGFGRTGTVDWQTSIKAADFTAVNGEGYFVNTTSGTKTVTLPSSPSVGSIVAVSDYAQYFATNACTIGRGGSNIDGGAADLVLNVNGQAVTLVYADATKGWKPVYSNDITGGVKYVTASGGTESTTGDYKIHTFTGPGTFTVSCAGNASGSNSVDYLVVAGGGGGANQHSAGGGAGGLRVSPGTASGCWTASPLGASPAAALALPATSYPITVGGGGAGGTAPVCSGKGVSGSNTTFSSITAAGGGGGGDYCSQPGLAGGSGGGGGSDGGSGGAGNTPPVSPPQGQNGGNGATHNTGGGGGGGGGGSGAVGAAAVAGPTGGAGNGGAGVQINIDTNNYYWSGGGGGGTIQDGATGAGDGGIGGGGGGAASPPASAPKIGAGGGSAINNGAAGAHGSCAVGGAGGANSGGGGGGGASGGGDGGAGGSGIVIIRYKYQ